MLSDRRARPAGRTSSSRRCGAHIRETDIVVVDSGLGGLVSLHEAILHVPRAKIAYVAASGPTSIATLGMTQALNARLAYAVAELEPTVVLVACDALAAAGLVDELSTGLTAKIVDLPFVRIATVAEGETVGVVASGVAADTGSYERRANTLPHPPSLVVRGSSKLDRLLSERPAWDEDLDAAIKAVTLDLRKSGAESIVLGASGAWLGHSSFRRYAGVDVIQRDAIAEVLGDTAPRVEYLHTQLRFYVVGDVETFRRRASAILQLAINRDHIAAVR